MFWRQKKRLACVLLLLACLLCVWFVNKTARHRPPVEIKEEKQVVIFDVAEKMNQPMPKIKKSFKQSSYELNIIEFDPNKPRKNIQRKPKVVLPLPANIEQSIGDDEWISRGIYDNKGQCARVLKHQQDDNVRSNMSCQIPNIDPFNPSIMKFIAKSPTSNCRRYRSCGKLVDGIVKITDTNVVSATYQAILRGGDFNFVLGTKTAVLPNKKITDEFIEVDYLLRNGRHIKEYFLQPVPHEHLQNRKGKKQPGIPLNILIVGLDSTSHANAKRKLPKFYNYLKKETGAIVFNGHSIVGDGTTEQLAAMLTGMGELEQYESRRHHRNPRPVDGWTWIYKQLKEHGYLTGYSGDAPLLGPFQFRLMGFSKAPTDFYTRPFYLRVASKLGSEFCLGSRSITQHQFQYIRDVFEAFPEKLKFFFSYNVLVTHDDMNRVESIEPDLISLIQDLKTKGDLNNTLLIVMGDHGSRFGKMRETIQGKLEERLPLFSMSFPPWFAFRYPKLYANLRTNTDRLTSWYDVYATFRHMLSYPEAPAGLKHGQSLLLEVPTSRTCKEANVEQHWCPCQKWSAVDVTDSHVQNAALAAVEYINDLNQGHNISAKYCELLSLKVVNYAFLERPNDKVLLFGKTNDLKPVFNARTSHKDFCRYQIQFQTAPNNGTYEATVRYHLRWFILSKSISRVNQYGDQPECIARDLPHLRKFCMCHKS